MNKTENYWVLETASSAYAWGLNQAGYLVHCYWGKKLPNFSSYPAPSESEGWASFNGPTQVLPEEYPAYGAMCYHEACLKITFADGVRDIVLKFDSAQMLENEVIIALRDVYYPLQVRLHYRAHSAYDLIERWAEVINEGDDPISLERIFSAQWHVPANQQYHLSHLTGRWNNEFQLVREPLCAGSKILESRRITSSHHHNPWFLLDDGRASETGGPAWFGALAWSGNWKLAAEVTNFGTTRLSLGINDWDFAWRLGGGETFVTPPAFAGYTEGGYGAASRNMHDFIREQVLPHGPIIHKVLYNSWEATFFNVDVESQSRLAEIAAEMGVELFVVDDGWFHGRKDDRSGLGDWWPDQVKFPEGLQPLIQQVNRLGMEFGLWIEPEMTNPDSQLFRTHPDWILHFPTRPPILGRNQCILNLGRPDVQEYLLETIDRLLSQNNIAFIKWDMNRNASEPGWADAPGDEREVWVRYVQGLYRVWGELRKRHPQVIWQSCSGGGGRTDLGILRLADQVWVSDNTHARDRLSIQGGFSMAYPPNIMEAWVTDADRGNLPLAFRFHVSMCGSLGVGGNLPEWSEEERAEAADWIARYKKVRDVIQLGDLFRLAPGVIQYLGKDQKQGVLFAFQMGQNAGEAVVHIQLQGLHPDVNYEIEGLAGKHPGSFWMSEGLNLGLGPDKSTMCEIKMSEA